MCVLVVPLGFLLLGLCIQSTSSHTIWAPVEVVVVVVVLAASIEEKLGELWCVCVGVPEVVCVNALKDDNSI